MRNLILACGVAAMIIAVSASHALARSVCYEVVGDVPTIYRIDVKYHSRLTTLWETKKFGFDAETGRGHPLQHTYTAQGNMVYSFEGYFMGTLDGTVTVARGAGARMGLTIAEVNDFVGYQHSELGCRSDEPSATPAEWTCEGLVILPDSTVEGSRNTLKRIKPLSNELCSRFSLDLD